MAAIVHDIGIHKAEKKYGQCGGKLQEKEGPPEAEKLLKKLGADRETIDRVCYLVGHHHTYTEIDGLDYQILIEADFLVNLYEDGVDQKAVRAAYDLSLIHILQFLNQHDTMSKQFFEKDNYPFS